MIAGKLMVRHFVSAVKAALVVCTTIMLAIKPITQTVSGRSQILLRISGTVLAIRNTIVLAIKPIAKT